MYDSSFNLNPPEPPKVVAETVYGEDSKAPLDPAIFLVDGHSSRAILASMYEESWQNQTPN